MLREEGRLVAGTGGAGEEGGAGHIWLFVACSLRSGFGPGRCWDGRSRSS